MLLTRLIPPPFLLPARGARRLYQTLQEIEDAKVQKNGDRGEEPRRAREIRRKSSNSVTQKPFRTRLRNDSGLYIKHLQLTKIASPTTRTYSTQRRTRDQKPVGDGTVLDSDHTRSPEEDSIKRRTNQPSSSQPKTLLSRKGHEKIKAKKAENEPSNGEGRTQEPTHRSPTQRGPRDSSIPSGHGSGALWKSLTKERWDASDSFKPIGTAVGTGDDSKRLDGTVTRAKSVNLVLESVAKGSSEEVSAISPLQAPPFGVPASSSICQADPNTELNQGTSHTLSHRQIFLRKYRKARDLKKKNERWRRAIIDGSLHESTLARIRSGQVNEDILELAKEHGIVPYTPEELTQLKSTDSVVAMEGGTRSSELDEDKDQHGLDEHHMQKIQRAVSADMKDAHEKLNVSRQPPKTLYEELFPEEKEASVPSSPQPQSKIVIKPFEWNKGLVGRWDHFNTKEGLEKYPPVETEIAVSGAPDFDPYEVEQAYQNVLQPVAVALEGVSPNLEESDFFRITPKGAHIEGWTSGIIKVIQSREALTLEPLGKYWILFTSEVAALAYIDQTIRLHDFAQKNVGGIMLPSTVVTMSTSEEDLQAALRSFSLVPGQHKLEMVKLRMPYQPGEAHMVRHSGPKHLKDLQPNEEGLVVFALTSGVATSREIKDVLDKDGRARNMLWGLVEDTGIQELNVLRGEPSRSAKRTVSFNSTKDAEWVPYTAPSKFVLTFKDRYEARRFVREWHRRPFTQPSLYGTDEEPPIVLAEYIW